MRLLDLFSGAGGAAVGYSRAGFEVVGVDIAPQPNYPFEFHQGDALDFLSEHGKDFDLIHASPPCQKYTNAQRIRNNQHPDLIASLRGLLHVMPVPYVIENVEGAPLINPWILCGSMFPGLRVYRHRLFESSFPVRTPVHPSHEAKVTKMGRPPCPGEFMHVVGNFSGVPSAREAMGISWMTRNELKEAIPPAFAEFAGNVFSGRGGSHPTVMPLWPNWKRHWI